MANIVFYDASPSDQEFFKKTLSDQALAFSPGSLNRTNVAFQADILSVFVSSTVTQELLNAFPTVKMIAARSTGVDHIDTQTAKNRGIVVCTVPTYGEHTVAEYAFGLLLSLTRKLPAAISSAREGSRSHAELQGSDLYGKVFGVIGAGRIGRNSAKLAKAFGMSVIAYDPMPNQQAASEVGFEYKPLDDVLRQADVISLHVPYTPENHHMINAERLAIMKPSAMLINTARGELIDTKALVEVVGAGRLAGVGLDVIESEQLISPLEELALLRADQVDSSLLMHSLEINVLKNQPNAIVTSHNAFNSKEAIERINQTTVDNIRAFLNGQPQNIFK